MPSNASRSSAPGIHIRRTQTRNTTTGERHFTHRLVRSQRSGGKLRQVTLFNLGRHSAVPQADWPTLCARLEEILSAQEDLLGGFGSLLVEREAQRLAAPLLALQGVATPEPAAETVAPMQEHSLAVNSLTLSRPSTVGVEAVGLWAMAQVDFIGMLEGLGLSGPSRNRPVGSVTAGVREAR